MKLAPLLLCLQAQEVAETPYETVVINVDGNSNTRMTFSRAAVQQVLTKQDDSD